MALRFGKRDKPDGDGNGKDPDAFTPQPENAHSWFHYARRAADTYNYDYALTCYYIMDTVRV